MADSGESPESGASARMACSFCRKRKLRCNRHVPKCDSCLKFGYDCEYGPPKLHPRREHKTTAHPSHVKRLEDRLGRVEELLQQSQQQSRKLLNVEDLTPSEIPASCWDLLPVTFEENIIRDLEQLFFVYAHPSINIIHQPSYLTSVQLGPKAQPPIFLRHALCALAASASKAYSHLGDGLYQSSRKHLQEAEIKDLNFDKVTLAQAQTWIIIAVYELKECFMHRSMLSISRAVRLVQLLRLHRVDGPSRVKDPSLNLLRVPGDWTQAEERRRLFWFTFLMDRYTGISMGWPTLIDTKDIRTLLPASDEAFENSTEEASMQLSEAVKSSEYHHLLSTFAAEIIGINGCCSRIQALSRLEVSTDPEDWTGNMWAKNAMIEAILKDYPEIPPHLSIPHAKLEPSNVFLNMGQCATIITVHRVATFHAGKSPLSTELVQISRRRCKESASMIHSLMKLASHWEPFIFHPCTTFCLYMAAMVFAEAWKFDPGPTNEEPLRFLIDSLTSFKKATRLSHNLLQDLDDEFPDLFAKLNGVQSSAMDIYSDLIDFNPTSPEPVQVSAPPARPCRIAKSLSRRNPKSGGQGSASENNAPTSNPASYDVTSWTVDDPDIATIGRFL